MTSYCGSNVQDSILHIHPVNAIYDNAVFECVAVHLCARSVYVFILTPCLCISVCLCFSMTMHMCVFLCVTLHTFTKICVSTEREKRHFPDLTNKPGVLPAYKPRGRRYIPHNNGREDEWRPHNQNISPNGCTLST